MIDRVGTTGTVWLGLTIACAQCHDHKFDPITQKEYYQFFAFFNNQDEPTLALDGFGKLTAARTSGAEALEEKIVAVEKTLQQNRRPDQRQP